MWNSCCRGPAPVVLLSGLVKSLPEFPSLLKVCKSHNWISCHLFSFNAWAGAFGQSSCMVWPWYLRPPWTAPSQGAGVWWYSLSESLSVQGNSLLVWKARKGPALMSSLPSIPCRSTGTASNPNSYYCFCKLESKKSSLQGNCRHINTKQQDIQAAKNVHCWEKGTWIPHGRAQEGVAD